MRRVLFALVVSVAIGAFAGPAHAQEDLPTQSMDAMAVELIAAGNASEVFEPVPSSDLLVLRHRASGLICRLAPANRNRLLIFPQAARGEDVACDSTDGNESITFYATRYSFEVTPQEIIDGAETAIRQRFPDARELPVSSETSVAGLPPSQSAQFMVTRDGAPMYTRVTVAILGQWVIKLRYTNLASDAEAAQRSEAAAIGIWTATLSELTQQRL